MKALLTADHDTVVTYVNAVIGSCTAAMSCATARYEDTAALDFINLVQGEAVRTAIAGTSAAAFPILSIAAPFYKDANIPAGDVSVRDVAGLYIYDNTLLGITFTGAQVKAYLEKSAYYFKQVTGTGPFTPDQLTNAVTDVAPAPNGTPDYNYDVMGGLDERLTYDIDVAQAPGSRILNLSYGVRRPGDRPGCAVRCGHQQLPAVRRRRVPWCHDGSGGAQRSAGDPAADHRLGYQPQGHRPADVRQRRLEARLGRPAGSDHPLGRPWVPDRLAPIASPWSGVTPRDAI